MEGDFIIAEVDGKAVLIDTVNGTSLYFNETAFLIFKLMREGRSPEEIREIILEQYDVDEKEVQSDIEEFIDVLKRKRISWGKRGI